MVARAGLVRRVVVRHIPVAAVDVQAVKRELVGVRADARRRQGIILISQQRELQRSFIVRVSVGRLLRRTYSSRSNIPTEVEKAAYHCKADNGGQRELDCHEGRSVTRMGVRELGDDGRKSTTFGWSSRSVR